MTPDQLLALVRDATTLYERTAIPFDPHNPKIDERLNRWCETVAKGNRETFVKRLAWDGWTLETAQSLLADDLSSVVEIPSWALLLQEALQTRTHQPTPFIDPHSAVPFEDVVAGLVAFADERLRTQVNTQRFSDRAFIDLDRRLLMTLSSFCTSALASEFAMFQVQKNPLFMFGWASSSTDNYLAFTRELLNGGLSSFFIKYPVLARLVGTVLEQWIFTNSQFIERLDLDAERIRKNFVKDPDKVIALAAGLSDRHHGGHTVIALTFASGLKILYKPRDISPDLVFNHLLTWISQRDPTFSFKTPRVIPADDYGWVEFVDRQACRDKSAVSRFYQRSGMLLGLVYILNGSDFHYENLIAAGEYPVLIDMEMLFQHQIRQFDDSHIDSALAAARQQLDRSVLSTGLLPEWRIEPGMTGYDVSGLGNVGGVQVTVPVPTWVDINTDSMRLVKQSYQAPPSLNAPYVDGEATVLPADYLADIVAGFEHMVHFLVSHKTELLEDTELVAAIRAASVRFIFRPTQIYASIFAQTLNPDFLKSGIDWSIEIEALGRPLVTTADRNPYWPLLRAEHSAFALADIPRFTVRCEGKTLPVQGENLPVFIASGFEMVQANLRQLDTYQLALQVHFIKTSFAAGRAVIANMSDTGLDVDEAAPITLTQAVQAAERIAEALSAQAIRGIDGGITWVALASNARHHHFALQPLDLDLYSGLTGIALFFAALAKVTQERTYQELALAALQPLRGENLITSLGIGGATGLGSVVYALVQIAALLDRRDLLTDAQRIATRITPQSIGLDRSYDVVSGAAGALLGLLALYRATHDSAVLAQAVHCGEHLIANRVLGSTGLRAWATDQGNVLTGLSHGAAGIAYALLRLYGVTNNPGLLTAATEALDYETSVFSVEAGNWPDYRTQQPAYGVAWCHGAPGIGLARLGGLPFFDAPTIRHDIEAALKTTRDAAIDNDHLCCGALGRAETLLTASLRLSRPDLLSHAQKIGGLIAERARDNSGYYRLLTPSWAVQSPGFFQGTAGIGYQLLRLAVPDLLPNILLWETN